MNKRVINEALRLCTNLWKAKKGDVIGNNCRKAEVNEDAYINRTFKFFMNEMRSFSVYGDEYDFKKQELEKIKVELNKLKK